MMFRCVVFGILSGANDNSNVLIAGGDIKDFVRLAVPALSMHAINHVITRRLVLKVTPTLH